MDLKVLLAPNGLMIFLGLGVLLVGIVVATHQIPVTDCWSGTIFAESESDKERREDINGLTVWVGLPAMAGGILAILGGAFGALGARDKEKLSCCMCSSVLSVVIAMILCFIALIVALIGKAIADIICTDNVRCNEGICQIDTGSCLTDSTRMCPMVCKDDYDSFCAWGDKSMAKMILAGMTIFMMCIGSIMNCSTICCCTGCWDGLGPQAVQVAPAPPAVIVGQAVGQPVATEEKIPA